MDIWKTLNDATLRQWYWFFEAGRPIKKGNVFTLKQSNFSNIQDPVFFLSTGRTGTAWFASLFKKDKNFIVFHEAQPQLSIQNVFYYNILQNNKIDEKTKIDIGKEIFLAGREEYLVYSYKTNKRFLETNNQYVFFAKSIAELIPTAKFVHLHRHPGEFVRSGLCRNWYGEGEISNLKLIKSFEIDKWQTYNQIQKISWLWNEVNSFILEFKQTIDSNRFFTFNFNELTIENVLNLSLFCGINISKKTIKKNMTKKVNVQEKIKVLEYDNWENKK